MAVQTNKRDLSQTLGAARQWIDTCLTEDGSMFSRDRLWTGPLIAAVRQAFVEHPDAGGDDFMTKLKRQMEAASSDAQRLMAEMIWALLLFPSNIGGELKRRSIQEIWALSRVPLDGSIDVFQDDVLLGIGSGGTGYNNHRWRELTFLISLAQSIKQRPASERRTILSDYDAFMDWVDTVPQEGQRQFRHMLRYLAFPDRVERMSSNTHRRAILDAYEVAPQKQTRKWTDRQLDGALQTLRTTLQGEHPGAVLDFYEPPLAAKWRPADELDDIDTNIGTPTPIVSEEQARTQSQPTHRPINLILYGPPGTGKTYRLRAKFDDYTDRPAEVDPESWAQGVLGNYGWRSILAAALHDLKRPARVPELKSHSLVVAKAKQRGRPLTTIQPTLWSFLQTHTPESVSLVKYSDRRAPFIFSKRDSGEWELLPEWRDLDDESAELVQLLHAGPAATQEPIRRYRSVTFHPSFGYEDFVRGIRPVVTSDDGATQFRVVDGVFKQICDEARANPSKRYALFIDEINRANIAKVFGELITLLEADKRIQVGDDGRVTAGMQVHLPGGDGTEVSEPPFGVPLNLDVYGTMNTADRSIALLDVALRRRFEFEEMEPDYRLVDKTVVGIDVGKVLRRLNDRLEFLLDRDHRIGHAYLMGAASLDDLRRAFRTQIIPLLQEYFFDDLARVAAVLACAPTASPFVTREILNYGDLFPTLRPEDAPPERSRYVVTAESTWTERSFIGLYADRAAPSETENPD